MLATAYHVRRDISFACHANEDHVCSGAGACKLQRHAIVTTIGRLFWALSGGSRVMCVDCSLRY